MYNLKTYNVYKKFRNRRFYNEFSISKVLFLTGTLEERGIAAWQSSDEVETSKTMAQNYEEGKEIYEIPLPKKIKQWHGWKYIPFMPDRKQEKRSRSLSGQWSRRKSLVAGVGNTGY